MSDTPRTDAAVNAGGNQVLNVANIARELERENAKLREALRTADGLLTILGPDPDSLHPDDHEQAAAWRKIRAALN